MEKKEAELKSEIEWLKGEISSIRRVAMDGMWGNPARADAALRAIEISCVRILEETK